MFQEDHLFQGDDDSAQVIEVTKNQTIEHTLLKNIQRVR
jgi:hypothetical protein